MPISSLHPHKPDNAMTLYSSMAKSTPADARSATKINPSLTTQLIFVAQASDGKGPTIQVLSFPMLSTDSTNQSRIIGSYGDDDNNLAPISIPGNLLRDSTSTLVPNIAVARYNLPALEADPLNLDAPDEAEADRLHYVFEDPEYAPSIALIPLAFAVPRGIKPPIDWDLSSGVEITEADFNCEAGRVWVKAATHVVVHQANKPIHLDQAVFKLEDLVLEPFNNFSVANNITTPYKMLSPADTQYNYVINVSKENINQARNQAPNQTQDGAPAATNADANAAAQDAALQRQADSLASVVTAVIAATNKSSPEPPQSRTDRETGKTNADSLARHQLMLASLEEVPDPNNPDLKITVVKLPDINPVWSSILETSKLPDAVRSAKEQFVYHTQQRAMSRDFHDRSSDFSPKAINAPFLTALKRASWADKNVSQDPEALKDQLGLYHFAPPRTGTVEYEARVAAELVTYRQEHVGESKTRISAKAHNLDYSGRLESTTDLHSTIGNLAMILTFIAENAKESELWKAVSKFHDIYLDTDGKNWLNAHLEAHKYIIAAVILEFQQVIAVYVRIANNLKYRLAVQDGKQINPQAYKDANEKARHVITTMNNLIPGVTLGHLLTEPSACKHFYLGDQANKEKQRAEKLLANQLTNQQRNENRTGGPRREQERSNPRNNTRPNTQGTGGAASSLTPEQIVTLKAQGIVKYSGPANTRLPAIADILEANGASGLSRICVMAIFNGRHCRWGAECKQKHIKRISDFTPANKTKFLAYVQAQPHVELTQPGTNA